ncbi:MAG: hypothetical protein KBT46_00985 [Ruminococcus sp.]|nr:hypothetical protein [Candidatus Copronaster equi]
MFAYKKFFLSMFMVLFAAYPSVSVAAVGFQCVDTYVDACKARGGTINPKTCKCMEVQIIDECKVELDTISACEAKGGEWDYVVCDCVCSSKLEAACNGTWDSKTCTCTCDPSGEVSCLVDGGTWDSTTCTCERKGCTYMEKETCLNHGQAIDPETCECIVPEEPNLCEPLPKCSDIGFKYTAPECGPLKKMKCPFDDVHYFCSKSDCNQVTYNSTIQYCTEYCADTPSMCVKAEYKTCDTTANTGLFGTGGVGTLHAANSTISSSDSVPLTGNHYVLGPINFNSTPYFSNAKFYNAGNSFPGNCENSGTPKLSSIWTYLSGFENAFNIDVDFDRVPYYPGSTSSEKWKASFNGNTNINVIYNPSGTTMNSIELTFKGDAQKTTNKLCVYLDNYQCRVSGNVVTGNCAGYAGYPFLLMINSNNADVTFAISGGNKTYKSFKCNAMSGGSCKEDPTACNGVGMAH